MTQYTLTVSPKNPQLTDEILIKLSGLAPGAHAVLRSELTDDSDVTWFAEGHYIADVNGEIDLASAPSEKGTYTGVDVAGLFWSMRPTSGADRAFLINADNKNHMLGRPNLDPLVPYKFTIKAYQDGAAVAETLVSVARLAETVEQFEVEDGRLRGWAFRQKDRSKAKGAIMTLTGSGGGVEMNFAPALASQGYDVFSLAYFAYPGVSEMLINIDLEYFEEGFEWMKREFGATKMAVQGASRGGELSLVLAAYLPHYVSGATPIVPMYAANSGWNHETGEIASSWTYKGKELPYAKSMDNMSFDEMRKIAEELPHGFPYAPAFRQVLDDETVRKEKAIPIERANGPILMISGIDDQMWDCAWGSDLVMNRLREKGYMHPYEHLALRETGHITPLPNTITTFTQGLYHTLAEIFLACGGTPEGTAHHSREMWSRMLAHYEQVFE